MMEASSGTSTNKSTNRTSLLASLTGGELTKASDDPLSHSNEQKEVVEEEAESDLFGAIPKASGLASSGLLSASSNVGDGGLFDTVDEDLQAREAEERAREEEERVREEEGARQRAAQIKAHAEAEAAAVAFQQQRQQQQQQQQQRQKQQQQQQWQQQQQQRQQQKQLDGDMQDLSLNDHHQTTNGNGFYRPNPQQQVPPAQQGYGGASYYYSTSGHATVQQPHAPQAILNPNATAGMHNSQKLPKMAPSAQPLQEFSPLYGPIRVSDPLLVQGTGLFSGPPHWTYAVTVTNPQPIKGTEYSTTNQVRRRFRHFVALEDRLREDCPGSILSPRPEKHPTRVIEEATSRQSAQFALARASELEIYLNSLRIHPIAGKSSVLKLFLNLPDHIGTAWPEVSSSLITRFQEASANTANKFSEATAGIMTELNRDYQTGAGEDSAEMLALASSEGLRIGPVIQAVPKMEGATALLREHAEGASCVGLELSRLLKTVLTDTSTDMITPIQILSSGLLLSGRRSQIIVDKINIALSPFIIQFKLCRYERMAFEDRRSALIKRRDIRQKADSHAKKLMMEQRALQYEGSLTTLEQIETTAAVYDECAQESNRQAEAIAKTIQSEVNRNAIIRKAEWSLGLKQISINMKRGCTERLQIWENARESFLKEFPDMNTNLSPSFHQQNVAPVVS